MMGRRIGQVALNIGKRTLTIAVLLGVCCVSTGCMSLFPPDWYCGVRNWDVVHYVMSESGRSVYNPDPGYVWLVLNVKIINNQTGNAHINPYLEEFRWMAPGGAQYKWQLLYDSPAGGLGREFQPKQSKEGLLFFMVPSGTVPTAGKLLWCDLYPEFSVRLGINLRDIPHRQGI